MLSFKQFTENLLQEGNRVYKFIRHQRSKYIIVMSVEKGVDFFVAKNIIKSVDNKQQYIQAVEINNKNTKQFLASLKASNVSYTKCLGRYKEYVDGEKIEVDELSVVLFINNDNEFDKVYNLAKKWAVRTYQDCILIASDGQAVLEYTCAVEGHSVGDVEYIGNLHIGDQPNINNYTAFKQHNVAFVDNNAVERSRKFFKQPIEEGCINEDVSAEKLVAKINEIRTKVAAAPDHKLDKDESYKVRTEIERLLDGMPVGIVLVQNTDAGNEQYKKVSDKHYGWERIRQPFGDRQEQTSFDIAQWLIAPAWVHREPITLK